MKESCTYLEPFVSDVPGLRALLHEVFELASAAAARGPSPTNTRMATSCLELAARLVVHQHHPALSQLLEELDDTLRWLQCAPTSESGTVRVILYLPQPRCRSYSVFTTTCAQLLEQAQTIYTSYDLSNHFISTELGTEAWHALVRRGELREGCIYKLQLHLLGGVSATRNTTGFARALTRRVYTGPRTSDGDFEAGR